MAAYTVPAGKIAVHNKTLVANVVDAVSFERDPDQVEVLTDGAAVLYVTTNGTTPTIGGQDCWIIPAVACARVIPHNGNQAVRLLSAGTPKYSVTAV